MPKHVHSHGPGCGHTAIEHDGHVDYLHDGHLCHQEGDKVEEHVLPVSKSNPEGCHHLATKTGHDAKHKHGPGCGHEAVPHGDHIDYLVDGELHHPHGDHCDDHGPVKIARPVAQHA
jgi:hypothetical protein